MTNGDLKGLRHFGSNFIYWKVVMYITSVELPLFTNILRVLYLLMVSIMTRVSSCGCLIPFTFLLEKTNVVIPSTMMLCYWVFDMNTVYLPLDCLSQGLVWSPNNRPSDDPPYFSYDLLRIVPVFFLMVINGLLFCPLAIGMAMGRGGAEGWDLRPRPVWIFLAPSPPRPAWRGKYFAPSPPLQAPRRPAKPRPTP